MALEIPVSSSQKQKLLSSYLEQNGFNSEAFSWHQDVGVGHVFSGSLAAYTNRKMKKLNSEIQ